MNKGCTLVLLRLFHDMSSIMTHLSILCIFYSCCMLSLHLLLFQCCMYLAPIASLPRAFSLNSLSLDMDNHSSPGHVHGRSLCLYQCPWIVHLFQWGCISLLLFASPPRAFSFKSQSWWRGLPQRSIPRPKDVLFACTSTPKEFISTSGAASLFSSLHLLRVHSLLNPHPDDVDYLSDPYHVQRMFSLLAPMPQKSSSLPVGMHLSSPLCISSACILF